MIQITDTPIEEREPEVFVEVDGYPGYVVSSWGTVISYRQGFKKILKPSPDKEGYVRVGLSRNGSVKTFKIHRLVALHFIPNPYELDTVNHKYGNVTNNYYKDLEWCTSKYNSLYDHKNLENNKDLDVRMGSSVTYLSSEQVLEIKNKLNTGNYTYQQLADEYQVGESTIYRIANCITYPHIDDEYVEQEKLGNNVSQNSSLNKFAYIHEEERIQEMFAWALWGFPYPDIAYAYDTDKRYIGDIFTRRRRKQTTDIFFDENGNLLPPILVSPIKFNQDRLKELEGKYVRDNYPYFIF